MIIWQNLRMRIENYEKKIILDPYYSLFSLSVRHRHKNLFFPFTFQCDVCNRYYLLAYISKVKSDRNSIPELIRDVSVESDVSDGCLILQRCVILLGIPVFFLTFHKTEVVPFLHARTIPILYRLFFRVPVPLLKVIAH